METSGSQTSSPRTADQSDEVIKDAIEFDSPPLIDEAASHAAVDAPALV